MPSQKLSRAEYEALREGATVLEADGHGDKVLQLSDGRIMKLFRVRNALSSARLLPYSTRFARNAARLRALDVPTVGEVQCFALPSMQRTGVLYQPLEGETLRRLGVAGQLSSADCAATGVFIAKLHQMGVLFRSIHLGNIVKSSDGSLGLIDIADMSSQSRPLRRDQRLRNFQHLFRPAEDHDYLSSADKHALIDSYMASVPERLANNAAFVQRIEKLGAL